MDTVKLTPKARIAILVDESRFIERPYLDKWLDSARDRNDYVQVVLLATTDTADTPIDYDFDVVIRNSGNLPTTQFHTRAIETLQDFSNLIPVLGITADKEIENVWSTHGVLVVLPE